VTTGPPGSSRLPPALRRSAVLDACSLLNLCAADPLLDDLVGLGARMAARKYEHLLLTSADVLKVWVASMGVDADTLREMIRRIEHRASVGCLMRSGRFSARPTVARPAGG